MSLRIKVCGLTEVPRIEQAVALGAAFLGFIFYPPSARCVRPDVAGELMAGVPDHVGKVGVVVDPTDAELETILAHAPLDILQLHGQETPERVEQIALRTGLRTMKAVRVETEEDLAPVADYAAVADLLLFDAKPPPDPDAIPGGNGLPFDWRLLAGRSFARDWALAGGLTPENIEAAVELVAPPIVDVSSGVEVRPGIKDPRKLEAFFAAAARAGAGAPGPGAA